MIGDLHDKAYDFTSKNSSQDLLDKGRKVDFWRFGWTLGTTQYDASKSDKVKLVDDILAI